jgi:hypothetical protein
MADDKKREDRERSKTSDDIMGISHGGGRDQYGGSFGGGQSGGGAYANAQSGHAMPQGGSRVGGDRGSASVTGGQSEQGYYGGGQMGDRNYGDSSHNAASRASGPEHGEATYRDHPSQHGGDVGDELSARTDADEHQGFGKAHQGQRAQGQQTDRSG